MASSKSKSFGATPAEAGFRRTLEPIPGLSNREPHSPTRQKQNELERSSNSPSPGNPLPSPPPHPSPPAPLGNLSRKFPRRGSHTPSRREAGTGGFPHHENFLSGSVLRKRNPRRFERANLDGTRRFLSLSFTDLCLITICRPPRRWQDPSGWTRGGDPVVFCRQFSDNLAIVQPRLSIPRPIPRSNNVAITQRRPFWGH